MTPCTRTLACISVAVAAAGCALVTEFDRSAVVENNASRCSDATDNDGNGLTDCQDFGCLGQDVCCTIPTLAIVDDFEEKECANDPCDSPDPSCDAIDSSRWQSWGIPFPMVCEGGLSPNKREQCYDVGVLSREGLALRPGLRVEVGIIGRPEIMGRLEAGLTFQEQVQSSIDPCEPLDVVEPVISVKQLSDQDGYRFVATFDEREVGVSERILDDQRHLVTIAIEADRRVHYSLDGDEFAQSPAAQPIPESEPIAHLSLAGRGQSARFDDVRVTAGTQCDAPTAWTPLDPFIALAESEDGAAWDSFAVYSPGVVRTPSGAVRMFYTGCAERLSECDRLRSGVGRADADTSVAFTRKEACPVVGATAAICAGGLGNPFAVIFNNHIDLSPAVLGGTMLGYATQLNEGAEVVTLTLFGDEIEGISVAGSAADRLRIGSAGAWDSYEICCATAVEQEGVVKLWYAGRDGPHASWRIGLAEANAGIEFEKHADNPVLAEGAAGSFDDSGVTAPSVIYDDSRALYRMWYEARGFLGVTSIGYAVSLDGVEWFKYPDNPVVAAEAVGLVSVGAPEVLTEGGRTLMWLHGEAGDTLGQLIYGLTNLGQQVSDDEPARALR